MSKYYFLKVKEVVQETEDTVSIHFWHPLNELIRYKAGQFLTLLLPLGAGNTKIRRSYSLSSSPYTDVSPAITVKRLPGGLASGFLTEQVKAGDVLEVMEPMGLFGAEPAEDNQRRIFLIGAGSGIAPLISIAKSVLIAEPESTVVLIYGNRSAKDIIFRGKLDELRQKYGDRLQIVYSLTQPPPEWQYATGRLTKTHLLSLLEPYHPLAPGDLFFLCGPEEMMHDARHALRIAGVPDERVLHESFATQIAPKDNDTLAQDDSRITRKISLVYEGETHVIPVAPHQSVLEAALEKDIDLPYSCQAGMCTACLGRVLSGNVILDEYDALTDAEVKEGFILTCVAHPVSDGVVIEVD